MGVKRRKRRVGVIPKFILLAFVIYSAITLISLQIKINSQKIQGAQLNSQIGNEQLKQAQLKQLLQADVDDDYVIGEAQKQGYAAPNERVFVDTAGK